ncbi:MAG: cupin domain-containing protein [candidate division Zixibacteria bacterium]|nr:cupin domain-containing protein [candidate division Zixibacteria bacterium]
MTETRGLKPFVKRLDGRGETHLPLLTSETARRMRAGMVTLRPGEECGRHSTEEYEELLIVLEGRGEAEVEGYGALALEAGRVAYIPPHTYHNVYQIDDGELRYVYVVAPAK